MSISDPTRKKLWSLSGNKCAMCKTDSKTEEHDVMDKNAIL